MRLHIEKHGHDPRQVDLVAVIALIAVGMTLVIVTGGIDLSVGSLIALSDVVTARLISDNLGG